MDEYERSGVPVVVGRVFRKKDLRTGAEEEVVDGRFRGRLDRETGRLTVEPGPGRTGLLKRMKDGDYISFESRRLGVGIVTSIDLVTGTALVESL